MKSSERIVEAIVKALPASAEDAIREAAAAEIERQARLWKVKRGSRADQTPGVHPDEVATDYGRAVNLGEAPTVDGLLLKYRWLQGEDIELLLDEAEDEGLITDWRSAPLRVQRKGRPESRYSRTRGAFICLDCERESAASNPRMRKFCSECSEERRKLQARSNYRKKRDA